MTNNIGSFDRGLRTVVGVILIALYFMGTVSGTNGMLALIAGGVLLITAAIGWCPPYALVGINTCTPKKS